MRDERWERVYGTIGPVPISSHDIETGFYKVLEDQIEVRVEVRYKGTQVYSVMRLHKDGIELTYVDIWKFTLDMMVEQIDEALDKLDRGETLDPIIY